MKHDQNLFFFPERQLNQLKYEILLWCNLFSPSTWIRNVKITQRKNITNADLCKWLKNTFKKIKVSINKSD